MANSGSGGGGAANANLDKTYEGGNGGSGIVIVRWGGYDKNYDPTDDSVS